MITLTSGWKYAFAVNPTPGTGAWPDFGVANS